jgi:HEAT repeats
MSPARPSPRQRVAIECSRGGRPAFVVGCVALLDGRDVDTALIITLGDAHAVALLAKDMPDDQRYWLRVWAARGLLWAYDDAALPAIRAALRDPAWRVREMAAKVVARHRLGDLTAAVSVLRGDPVQRVSAAATRALAEITRAGS